MIWAPEAPERKCGERRRAAVRQMTYAAHADDVASSFPGCGCAHFIAMSAIDSFQRASGSLREGRKRVRTGRHDVKRSVFPQGPATRVASRARRNLPCRERSACRRERCWDDGVTWRVRSSTRRNFGADHRSLCEVPVGSLSAPCRTGEATSPGGVATKHCSRRIFRGSRSLARLATAANVIVCSHRRLSAKGSGRRVRPREQAGCRGTIEANAVRVRPARSRGSDGAIDHRRWAWVELNYRPHAYQACALTT